MGNFEHPHDLAAWQPTDMIAQARAGDERCLGTLIDRYRPYLKLLARLHQDPRLRARLDDSDLVQDVSTSVIRDFRNFRGSTEGEFAAWLRTIMARVAMKAVRHNTNQQRDVRRELEYRQALDASSCLISQRLAVQDPSPSERAQQREAAVIIAEVLDRLPDPHREVIILRDFEGLDLAQIAARMQRSPEAVRKLWARAIVQVRESLKGST